MYFGENEILSTFEGLEISVLDLKVPFFFLERYTFGLQQWAVFISKKMLDFLFLTC